MRESGLISTGPNAAKSTTGTAGSAPPPGAVAGAGAPPDSAFFTNAFTSSCVMRPLNPVPVTFVRSTPSSRASRRTEGPACAREKPGSFIRGRSARIGAAPSVRAGPEGRGARASVEPAGAPDDIMGCGPGGAVDCMATLDAVDDVEPAGPAAPPLGEA